MSIFVIEQLCMQRVLLAQTLFIVGFFQRNRLNLDLSHTLYTRHNDFFHPAVYIYKSVRSLRVFVPRDPRYRGTTPTTR